jgi:hypothetical protein
MLPLALGNSFSSLSVYFIKLSTTNYCTHTSINITPHLPLTVVMGICSFRIRWGPLWVGINYYNWYISSLLSLRFLFLFIFLFCKKEFFFLAISFFESKVVICLCSAYAYAVFMPMHCLCLCSVFPAWCVLV